MNLTCSILIKIVLTKQERISMSYLHDHFLFLVGLIVQSYSLLRADTEIAP